MEERVVINSGGLALAGILQIPSGSGSNGTRAAFLVLHGFGGNKDGTGTRAGAGMLAEMGYATLRFDMRGCGESEGEPGRVICLEQVEDTLAALEFLARRPEIDANRIGIMGSSFGAAVAVYTAGVDPRPAAVISVGGWGDGERKFRGQHPTPEAWAKFTGMLERGRRHREETGQSLMVPRFDIVPIPEHLRSNMSKGGVMEFPAETAQSMFDFRADDVVGNITPRPLLLLHSAQDSVTPTEQSAEMFKRAGQPTDLILLSDVDHFTFGEHNPRVRAVIGDWLAKYLPARV
jgi:pimeloyl-ACP methyl ester carboxylesterase